MVSSETLLTVTTRVDQLQRQRQQRQRRRQRCSSHSSKYGLTDVTFSAGDTIRSSLHLTQTDYDCLPPALPGIINSYYVINLDSTHAHSFAHRLRDVIDSPIIRVHSERSTHTFRHTHRQTSIIQSSYIIGVITAH